MQIKNTTEIYFFLYCSSTIKMTRDNTFLNCLLISNVSYFYFVCLNKLFKFTGIDGFFTGSSQHDVCIVVSALNSTNSYRNAITHKWGRSGHGC